MQLEQHPFIQSVEKTIHHFDMLQAGDAVLVAVSGGPDSVALLHTLKALQSRFDFQLAVAHLNHGLRPITAETDAEFVAALCRKQGLPCHLKTVDLNKDQNARDSSLEARARRARYDFFDTLAQKNRYTKIALGHHANDNAELILMNFFRGSGSLGLAGIPPIRDQRIIRPLFHKTRQQIEDFLRIFKLEFVQDKTNLDTRFLRNRIRHRLLPELQHDYNPNLVDTLNRTADVFRSEQDFMQQSAQNVLDHISVPKDAGLHLTIASLRQLHVALQRCVIRLALVNLKGNLSKITFRHIESVLRLCHHGTTGQRLSLPDGISALLFPHGELRLVKSFNRSRGISADDTPDAIPLLKVALPSSDLGIQQNEFNHLKITIVCQHMRVDTAEDPTSAGQNTAFFDMDQLTSPLVLRHILPGDRFRPLGMLGTQKVKNFLINNKIPREERCRILVLLNQNCIVWILGHRIDDRFRITPQTKNVLKIEINNHE